MSGSLGHFCVVYFAASQGDSGNAYRRPMMSKNIRLTTQGMLERPPILVDEDRADYNDLFEMLCEDECPQTMEEWILVADIAYADWEVFRLRGLKVRGFHAALLRVLLREID